MNPNKSTAYERLAAPHARIVDEVCNRFEAALKADQRPREEDYLGDCPEHARAALRIELMLLAAHYGLTLARSAQEPSTLTPTESKSPNPRLGSPTAADTFRPWT